jgi:hypothetical protein
MATLLDSSVSGHIFKTVNISLSEEEMETINNFIKIYYFGDSEITNEDILKHPKNILNEYGDALRRIRSGSSLILSLSFNHKGNPCIKINQSIVSDTIEAIQTKIGCSLGCATDIYMLRGKLDWSREKELEIIDTHNAGVPSHVSLF